MSDVLQLPVRFTDGTHIARFQGKSASSTVGPVDAAKAVLRKVFGAAVVDGLVFDVTASILSLYTVTVTGAQQAGAVMSKVWAKPEAPR